MAEIRTLTTLESKRDEILGSIAAYERKLEAARSDLAHINAIIRLFQTATDPRNAPRYSSLYRLFRRHEKAKLALEALAGGKELSTREIALHVIKAKGFDAGDSVLAITMTQKLAQGLMRMERKGQVVMVGKRKGMSVWRLPQAALARCQ